MPKVIQPRRLDKSLNVDDFWTIRNEAKAKPTHLKAPPAYKQDEVLTRNRYKRPSDKAKTFNPLALMLRRLHKTETNELYQIGEQDQDTCVAQYLNSVQGMLTSGIREIKKLVMGQKSIIHNAHKIYNVLLAHLEYQDTWPLLQAVIKDTRGQPITFWLNGGLQQMVAGVTVMVASNFNEIVFRNLFDTLCVLMQTFYDQIAESINEFFAEYAAVFFASTNKYLRQFAVQSFSYILINMTPEQYNQFMHQLLQHQHQGLFHGKVSLADLLLQRLKVVRGCLSAASLTHCIDQIETLAEILNQAGNNTHDFNTLTADYIYAVLSALNNRQGTTEDQILFDFNHVLSALIQFGSKLPEVYGVPLVIGLSRFIGLYRTEKKRFQPYNNFHGKYLTQMWNILSKFYKQTYSFFQESTELFFALSVVIVKSSSSLFYDSEIIKYFRAHPQAVSTLVEVIYDHQEAVEPSLIQILTLLSKDLIREYLLGNNQCELVYMLIINLKRGKLERFIDCTWLDVTAQQIINRIDSANVEGDLIVLLRLITFLSIPASQDFINKLGRLKQKTLKQYEDYMTNILNPTRSQAPQQLYNSQAFSKQIVLYSHHEIGWLSHIFNLFQAFSQAFQHIQKISGIQCRIEANSCWNQLIISRPSAVAILHQSGYLTVNSSHPFVLNLLASRNREVRYHTLRVIIGQFAWEGQQAQLLDKLAQIDEHQINLDNERDIKRIFCQLQEDIKYFSQNFQPVTCKMLEYFIQWAIGFAFTGFKLIQASFITFLSKLIDNSHPSGSSASTVETHIMPFLQYYHYRHSRQYEYDLSNASQKQHLVNAFQIRTNQSIHKFVKEDLELTDVETVEWIGLERVAEAIKVSKGGKKNLGLRLKRLVQTYFSVQFLRMKNTIQSHQTLSIIPPSYLLPIKQRFLVTVLKLCPSDILPPMDCLHHTRDQFFELPTIRAIKRNSWQAMWQKKKSNTAKKKIQVTQNASKTINLQHLGPEQQQMYLHYLWKDILQSNRHKKRAILDHIRNYLPTASNRLIQIFFESLFLQDLHLQPQDPQTITLVANRLRLINRKLLLNHMFILKSLLINMRQQVNEGDTLKRILIFILAIIQIVYEYSSIQTVQEEEQGKEQVEEEDQEVQGEQSNADDSNGEGKQTKQKSSYLYKLQRKQLQKLLQTLFSNHQLNNHTLHQLLQFLLINTKINLAKSSRLSIPGLLLILNIVSQTKPYSLVLVQIKEGRFVTMLSDMIVSDEAGSRPLKGCYALWMSIFSNILLPPEESMQPQDHQLSIDIQMKKHSNSLLSSMLSYINSDDSKHQIRAKQAINKNQRKDSPDALKSLKIINKLMSLQQKQLQQGWQQYIWGQLSKVSKLKKNLNAFFFQKLNLLISILSSYIRLKTNGLGLKSRAFLRKIIGLLPNIKNPQQRLALIKLIAINHHELSLSEEIVSLVSKTNEIKKTALVITMDFTAFFESCNQYTASMSTLKLIEHEYYLHSLLCYVDHEQLSVRRAVSSCNRQFLAHLEKTMKSQMSSQQESEEQKEVLIELVVKIFRVLMDLLHKVHIQHNQAVFWSIVDNIGAYYEWIATCAQEIQQITGNSNAKYYSRLNYGANEEEKVFKLLGSISQSNKFKALKTLKLTLQTIATQNTTDLIAWQTTSQLDIPNPFSKVVLPILQYLIIHPTEPQHNAPKSNLASSLALTSLQSLPLVSALLKPSIVKKQLKRLVSKLKFSDIESRKNMAVIKMISQVVEGVPGERANEKLQSYLDEHRFEEFHNKIAQHSRSAPTRDDDDQSASEQPFKKERVPDFYDQLEELESEEAINRNFMKFDKKLMEVEEEDEQIQETDFSFFLRKQVLLPLRAMLMMENKGKQQEQKSKSKVLLSVTVTKVLLRLPLDLFLRQFQKVISKLGRLLKKREVQVREGSRSCLCEIAKSVGPQLLYAIIMELRFQLKDNFDKHVFNYSLARILQHMQLQSGQLDYCIPLILPMVIDEVYGLTSLQKDLVDRGEVPTLKMQAKKKKGLELLQTLARYISHHKLGYLIDFLQKYLKEHLVTEENLGKYDNMLGAIASGLAANPVLLDPANTPTLLPTLSQPIASLREQIRLLHWEDKPVHENTLRTKWGRRKAGKEQVLTLQEQAGRNGSIFKRLTRQAGQKRNREIVASSLVQFYLVLMSVLIRKQVFTMASTTFTMDLGQQLLNLLGFLNECLDHRDNRLVSKSLKLLHFVLSWNLADLQGQKKPLADRFKALKKQASRKILLLIEQLTLADEELLRQAFVFFNDLIGETALSVEMLPNVVAVIKLHTPTSQDQPHLPEPYKLLRTILCKGQLLYNPLLQDLHQMIRMQIVTCRNRDIRQVSKNILSMYLRPRTDLQPSIDAFNNNQKKQGKTQQLTYEKAVHDELAFYLSNLESTGQTAILELLQEFVETHEKEDMEQYGQLMLLSLMTARTNRDAEDAENQGDSHPIDGLVAEILKRLDQNKIIGLVQKCLNWIGRERLSSVRLCGSSFLRIILGLKTVKINKHFASNYLTGPNGLLAIICRILQQQAREFETTASLGSSKRLADKKWNEILNNMQIQIPVYKCDRSVTQILQVLTLVSNNKQAASIFDPPVTASILCSLWKLLHCKDAKLVDLLIPALQSYTILPVLLDYSADIEKPFSNQKHQFSLKKVVASLLFNSIKIQPIEHLLKQILTEQYAMGQDCHNLKSSAWLLVGLALKAHIKPNIYQQVLPNILSLINTVILSKDINGYDCLSVILQQPNFEDKLMELTLKLAANELIPYQSKLLVQQITEILKERKGIAEYFKAVGAFETRKRAKKEQQKIRVAELAILDPVEFAGERRSGDKRRKLE